VIAPTSKKNMANASAKRIAAQNEVALRNLQRGMFIANILYFSLRFLLPWRAFPPSWGQLTVYGLTALPTLVLYRHLSSIGLPRRDPTTGILISSGEDLNQPGVTEWCWDVIYVTWGCAVGSSLLGNWVWYLYLSIPAFACYKIYSSFISPMLAARSGMAVSTEEDDGSEGLSKRQQKLKSRSDKTAAAQKRR
jgi:hypothetical protein